jgi:hypothetical protein
MSPTAYLYLADLVAFAHMAVLAYVVVGQLYIIVAAPFRWRAARNPWFRFTHLGVIAFVVYEQFYNIRCFLSVWEEKLKERGGVPANAVNETFVGRVATSLFKFEHIPQDHPFFFAIYIGMFLIVVQGLIMYPPRMFTRWRWRKHLPAALTTPLEQPDPVAEPAPAGTTSG